MQGEGRQDLLHIYVSSMRNFTSASSSLREQLNRHSRLFGRKRVAVRAVAHERRGCDADIRERFARVDAALAASSRSRIVAKPRFLSISSTRSHCCSLQCPDGEYNRIPSVRYSDEIQSRRLARADSVCLLDLSAPGRAL
jgi:hypothetical protein